MVSYCVVPHAGTWIEILTYDTIARSSDVVPHAGTWIEIFYQLYTLDQISVVPHAGTWIEIVIWLDDVGFATSFPTRERGLKLP